MVVLWSYYCLMSSVVKRSVSLPADLFARLENEAAEEGRTVSAALSEAADLWLSMIKGLRAVRAWERENGALTAAELAEADAVLDRAGVGAH
jgi:negative regulator of sigma E activity